MRAFAIDELGQPGAVHDLPVPEPTEGQVRIRVAAAGLNPFDFLTG
jgi:NADPH:quinone reductase-like Zn-dependent oxidoreductase